MSVGKGGVVVLFVLLLFMLLVILLVVSLSVLLLLLLLSLLSFRMLAFDVGCLPPLRARTARESPQLEMYSLLFRKSTTQAVVPLYIGWA